MIHRKISADDLKALAMEDLTKADKRLIEKAVREFTDKDETVKQDAMRGFLVQECEESIIDYDLRLELPGDAASFSEGWDAAFKFGGVEDK
jgi:hypothetical protein